MAGAVIPTAPKAMLQALLRDDLLRRMLKNASYLLSGTAGASFLGLVALALTARALGPELLGVLALIQAYNGMVDRARMETWPALIKYGAEALEHERRDDFKSLIKFGFLLDVASSLLATLIAVAGVYVAGWWLDWSRETMEMASLFSLALLFRTSSMPTAKPCTALFSVRISIVTLRSKVSIQRPASVCSPKPSIMLMRGSTRVMKPAVRNPIVMPMPRLPITQPTSASGKPMCCCNSGGSSTIGVKLSMP